MQRPTAISSSRAVGFGAPTCLGPSSVGTSSEGGGLPLTEAAFVMEAKLEAVVLLNASTWSTPTPAGAPSFGESWSETSPSAVLYHWHWKSFFQISAGSGSAVFVVPSSSSVAFASSGWDRKWCKYMETSVLIFWLYKVKEKVQTSLIQIKHLPVLFRLPHRLSLPLFPGYWMILFCSMTAAC